MTLTASGWAAVAGAVAAVCTGCSSDADVSRAIGTVVRERAVAVLELSGVTSFAWDEVYFFAPYTPRSDVCGALGIAAPDCVRSVPFVSRDDGEMSIAFLHRGRLVNYVRHGRGNGDFTPVPTGQPLTPANAVFRVVRDPARAGGRPWFRLVPAWSHEKRAPGR